MIFIQQEITEFTYSNIVSTVPDYSPTTNYLLGDLVRVGSYHYKALYGTVTLPNIGKDPLTNIGTAWFEYEPSNIYACLDPYGETKTTWTADGIIEFTRNSKDTLVIGDFTASLVTIEYLDALDVVVDTVSYTFTNNSGRNSPWTYGYARFSTNNTNVIYFPILRKGVKIRVTFSKDGFATDCGFFHAGRAEFMGKTREDVSFPDKRVGNKTVNVADFTTTIEKQYLMNKVAIAKSLIDAPMVFIIDENENSYHQNMVILGKITKCDSNANNFDKNQINWQIEQNILI